MTATWAAPNWVHSFYSRFPLVVLEPEDKLPHIGHSPSLWITPGQSSERPWASSDPECLQTQLLFLLRACPVAFRDWSNPKAAPAGRLPALHISSEKLLLPSHQIREWLDKTQPLDELNGMPDQETYDRAVALAQLVLGRIRPMRSGCPNHQDFPIPPPLAAGLTTPLPASLTGDERTPDIRALQKQAQGAWDAVQVACKSQWALGAKQPTPLDALIAAYVFTEREALSSRPALLEYAARVMDRAQAALNRDS